jgi:cytochrome c peroxidase
MALVDQRKRLLIANRDSGTLTTVDTERLQLVGEVKVGRRLGDLACDSGGKMLAVADEEAGEVVLLQYQGQGLREELRVKVGVSPVSVQLSGDGNLAAVACLWPRRLVLVDLAEARRKAGGGMTQIDLPFAPRRQLLLPGNQWLIVADAFGGKLAVVNVPMKKLESVRDLPVHNIRGLALSRDKKSLLLTHQVLYARGRTTRSDIQTGNLLTNNLTVLALGDVLQPGADVLGNGKVYQLGDVERGAGDPATVVEEPSGQVLVAIAGLNELHAGRPAQTRWKRLSVGRRPTALVVDEAKRRAYLANTFGDSISVVDLNENRVLAEVRLGPAVELRAHERGELLFFDARRSFDAWFSCHSCHPDGHSNGLLNDNFTDGSFGTPKRVLSLLGVRNTGPWAWNGHMSSLEAQVRNSLTTTMRGPAPTAEQVADLTAYLRTLAPPPPIARARGTLDAEAFQRGKKVFTRLKCVSCHPPPMYTSPKIYDVGLRDPAGQARFNPPSLRGISQAGPYFHDNRARTLEDVFTRHRHQLSEELSDTDRADLLHFLGGL